MAIYTISDLHLSLSDPEKSMDIFRGWENYVQRIYDEWIKTILPDDTVVIVGDVSWAMKLEDTKKDFEFIHKLPGQKILVKGNHDFWWSSVTKIKNFVKENGFDTITPILNDFVVCEDICICGSRGWILNPQTDSDKKVLVREAGRLRMSIEKSYSNYKKLEKVVFMHYPPVSYSAVNNEILDILVENNIKRCYYGHIHGNKFKKNVLNGLYNGVLFNLVSCDYLNFRPLRVK